jgi:hypothetical protein
MTEAGVLISKEGKPLYWHVPEDRSTAYLPDSRDLWEVIWDFRDNILGFAHSHPPGCDGPSQEDVTTFAAVEAALGRRLAWWIVTDRDLSLVEWCGPDKLDYMVSFLGRSQLPWVPMLRRHSNF